MNKLDIQSLIKANPIINELINKETVVWLNRKNDQKIDPNSFSVTIDDVNDGESLWKRFSPFLKTAYPELESSDGIIESPLNKIDKMKSALEKMFHTSIHGELFLKCDDSLPIAGSVKARGGFFEILY